MAAEKGVIWLLRAAMNLLYKVLSVDYQQRERVIGTINPTCP